MRAPPSQNFGSRPGGGQIVEDAVPSRGFPLEAQQQFGCQVRKYPSFMATLGRTRMEAESHPEKATDPAVRTFLFADIRGYTRFIVEQGDAAGVRFIERFASLARRVLTAGHGEILSLTGDEVFAVFVSAREALRTARALQAGFIEASVNDPSIPIEVGIGLDTGEAVQSGDTYLGAAVNLAARLCKLAGPQEVLASDGVVHVARKLDGIRYTERGLAQLKGFREPVRVFQVVEETPESAAGPPAGGSRAAWLASEPSLPIGAFLGALPSTELVAREDELRRALAAADAAAAGKGRLVLLAGEPGVGKTRLEQEVMLNVRNRQFLVATGRCYEIHQSVPFYPFTDLLTEAYTASPPALRESVPERWPYLCRLLPELKTENPSSNANTTEEQQRLFRAVTGFLQAVSAELPVALLLDDLHCADGASLELLEHLARHTRADRILLVGTYRDAEVSRHHPLEAALRDLMREDLVERIPVRRLESEGAARLIAATLGEGEVSRELVAMIHRQAEGNPFFTQQLVRFLVERGDVYKAEGRWIQRPLRQIEVPDSIRSVIGQRMERLKDSTQEVLREASVLGPKFLFDTLVRVSGRAEIDVEDALEEARVAGLVEEGQRDQYAFDHALTQQALYAELPVRRRRRLHLAAAEALEQLAEGSRLRFSTELAWHFVEAAQEERALPYALAAGDYARSVFAYREAERQYTTALEVAEQARNTRGEVDALARRAQLRENSFQGKGAAHDYERLLEAALGSGDRPLELQARLGLAGAYYIVALDETEGDSISRSRAMYESAQALAGELGDKRAMVLALLGTRWFTDFWPELRDRWRGNVREALAVSQQIGDEELVLECELATWRNGTRPEAEPRSARLVRQLKERQDPFRLNLLYFSMMWAQLDWAEFERAVETCDAGIRLTEEIGVPPVQYPTLKAVALAHLGRFGEAWEALQREVTDAEHPFGRAMQALGMGVYYFELQAGERATEALRDLLQRARGLRRAWMTRWGLVLLARSLLRTRPLDPATVREIREELRVLGPQVPHDVSAEILLAEKQAEAALLDAEAAVVEASAEDRTADLLDARELQVRVLLELGRATEALSRVEEACRIAEERHALSLVWRLQALKARALAKVGNSTEASEAVSQAAANVRRLGDTIRDPQLRHEFFAAPSVASVLRTAE
jgi:class 3 adenylate cyclase/tetratricopeptide (TPR) repeat protein